MKTSILFSLLCGVLALGAGFIGDWNGEYVIAGWTLLMAGLLLFVLYAINGRPTS